MRPAAKVLKIYTVIDATD